MAGQRTVSGKVLSGLYLCVGLVIAAAFWPAPAAAQRTEVRPLLDRLDRVERELNLLQRQIYRGRVAPMPAPAPAGASAPGLSPNVATRMEVRLNELESELRNVTGQAEEVSYAVEQLRTRIEKLVSDVDLRLSALEQSAALARVAEAPAGAGGPGEALAAVGPAMAEPGPVPGAPPVGEFGVRFLTPPAEVATAPAFMPTGTPEEQYDSALKLLRQADYGAAERALKAFIDGYPDDKLAENAQYWLGETFYVRSDYANAAAVFAKGFQKFSKGAKAPDSLLKLGMSLGNLGEMEEACTVFASLEQKFPDAPLNVRVRATREKKNLGCE